MGGIINFDNVLNVRDFGGQTVVENQSQIVMGKLYRGAQLSKTSLTDRERFAKFGISIVVDFRYHTERTRQPSRFGEQFHPDILEILAQNEQSGDDGLAPHEVFILHELNSVKDARNYMLTSYAERPHDPAFSELASRALKHMSTSGDVVYVHCAAGKDRTGTFVAILLMLLGVSADDVLEDYMRTRQAVDFNAIKHMAAAKMEERYGRPYNPDALAPFFGVYPEFLQASLGKIGDVHSYAETVLGLTPEDMARLEMHYKK